MHHYHNAHKGHTDHCCLCIPVNVGAHILGFLVTLGFFLNVAAAIGAFSIGPAAAIQPVLSAILTAYPAVTYLLLVKKNKKKTRKNFAKAYKILVKITNVLIFIAAITMLTLSILSFSNGLLEGLFVGLGSFVACLLVIFLNVHFNRVVQTYKKHGKHHDQYVKF